MQVNYCPALGTVLANEEIGLLRLNVPPNPFLFDIKLFFEFILYPHLIPPKTQIF